jgi:hypothetical protein
MQSGCQPVGPQRSQAGIGDPLQIEIRLRPRKLGGDINADRHADDPPTIMIANCRTTLSL